MLISMRTGTKARFNFDFALRDVKILLDFHDSETSRGKGRPARELEVFKRAGVILAITVWETFIEDTLTNQFRAKLDDAESPKDVESTFNSVAKAWLERDKVKPPELAKWALDGWKSILLEKFTDDIEKLNTPNSANIRSLFKRYLGADITNEWRWQGVSAKAACGRLDALISLRGRLVHRGRELYEARASVGRHHVINAIALLGRLVDRTETSLGIAQVVTSLEGS